MIKIQWEHMDNLPLCQLSVKYPASDTMSLLASTALHKGSDPNAVCKVFKNGAQSRRIEVDGRYYYRVRGVLSQGRIDREK